MTYLRYFQIVAMVLLGTTVVAAGLAVLGTDSDPGSRLSQTRSQRLPPAISTELRGFSRARYDDSGRKLVQVEGDLARLVAPKIGPFRVAPLTIVEAQNLTIALYAGGLSSVLQTFDSALGRGNGQNERIMGLEAEGFDIALTESASVRACEIRAEHALWQANRHDETQRIRLQQAFVTGENGRRLRADRLELELPAATVRVRGPGVLWDGSHDREVTDYEGGCNLSRSP